MELKDGLYKIVVDFRREKRKEPSKEVVKKEVIDPPKKRKVIVTKELLEAVYQNSEFDNFIKYIEEYKKDNDLDEELTLLYCNTLYDQFEKGERD